MSTRRGVAARRWTVPLLTLVALSALLSAIVAAPWIVKAAAGRSADWSVLSDIGQAYGGVSAILSGLAFCGVAGSLILQARQVRMTQIMGLRERHFELVRMGLDDPDLTFSQPPDFPFADGRRWKAANLWVTHWSMQWQMRTISEAGLRAAFDDLFTRNDVALNWWATCGPDWDPDPDRRLRRFLAIANESYRNALSTKPADSNATGAADSSGADPASVTSPESPGRQKAR